MDPSPLNACFLLSCLLTLAIDSHSAEAVSPADTTARLLAEADGDRLALLCFKSQLSDPTRALAAWNNNTSLDICSWRGVTCNNTRQPSRVTELDLESSQLAGIISPCVTNLTFLEKIHLPNNRLSGKIPPELGDLQMLRYLNFSSNSLSGNIPSSLGTIPSIAYVDLASNDLTGQLPESLAGSSSLQVLKLGKNNLGGEIPPVLFNSSSLVRIDLQQNNFTGSIPPVPKIMLMLQYLNFMSNNFSGSIPPSLGNISSLLYLYLEENNLIGGIPESLGHIPGLRALTLTANRLSGQVPLSLYNTSTLVYLDLRHNLLIGRLPNNIGNLLPNIQTLILEDNKFDGTIPGSLANVTSLEIIDLANNSFSGAIPSLGSLQNLTYLDFSINHLQDQNWSFLSSLSNCTRLTTLGLMSNYIEGNLPSSIGSLPSKLDTLWLSLNRISGNIPPEIGNLKSLTVLMLHDNQFVGSIPSVIGTLRNLSVLSLSGNRLSGPIPDSIGNLEQLTEFYLRENELNGSIPKSLGKCKNLQLLNFSHNSLDGRIPAELLKITSLSEGLDLSHNKFSGVIPQEVGGLINLGVLNISNNHLSGQIPSTLGQCVVLESLRMEGNLLEGSIPQSFMSLRGIREMDLSRNNLSGEIPQILTSLDSLQYLNLSFNDFSGAVPSTGVFANDNEVSVQGNKRLCAGAPMLGLPLCSDNSKRTSKSLILKILIPLCVVAAILLSCFFAVLLKRRRPQPSHQGFREQAKVSYEDIVKATNRFSSTNLVGSGSFGTVYKGTMAFDTNPIAIKVFNLNFHGASRSFAAECEALRSIRHRNLVKIITSCSTIDPTRAEFKALIFEYMPNGSLDMWLHPKAHGYNHIHVLTLAQRISIVQDVAFALDYLHNQCVNPLVHCDLKPQNVLLDCDMTACVSDFGLARFLCINSASVTNGSTSLSGLKGSIGYIAPEYGMGSKISTEGDVYSFGVLLLEILTGKQPTDESFKNGTNLHSYVNSSFPDKAGETLDPNIMHEIAEDKNQAVLIMHSCIIPLMKLGLWCSMEFPKDRPGMEQVTTEIHAISSSFSNLNVQG
ncbi:probable LRR receptor-like serine/threonine-protein kinase At3g47570 [Phragmites australis]|uniref:probable LRR receptor-like serine/threonine-protein kinase At3g47570 n=1 Tax=Phragmites australis TaxID=29695 RepID=UPI002D7707FE|nr:probable LRR receptor-like serine/threonine-protein kinase At3g47570 [Phragmites australis]